ncbi:MAG: hypothetical protein U0V72_04750 [Cytophagales bacterium]
MSFLLAIFLPTILGWFIINVLKSELNNSTKIGISFPIGIGITTFLGFIATLLGLKYNLILLLVIQLVAISIIFFIQIKYSKQDIIPKFKPENREKELWVWWLIWGIILYLLYLAIQKGAYWPITEFDSVCGYDFSAKYLVKDGTFENEMMKSRNFLNGNRYLYPPFVACLDAYGYLCNLSNNHILMTVLYFSFLVTFYGISKNYTSIFLASMGTLLLMITPEMFAHATFSLANLPTALYSGLGMIVLSQYFKDRNNRTLYFSILLTGLGLWCRTDSIVFYVLSVFLLALFTFFISKNWLNLVIFACLSILPYLMWNFFTSKILKVAASEGFIKTLAIDNEKIETISKYVYEFAIIPHQLYAISFTIFWIFLILNLKWIYKDIFSIAPLFIGSLILYAGLFYFIDGSKTGVSIKTYMEMALKRGLFTLVPLSWYFVITSPIWDFLNIKSKELFK